MKYERNKQTDARMDAYLDGELSSEESLGLVFDLADDPARFDGVAETERWIHELRRPVPSPDMTPRVMNRLSDALPGFAGRAGRLRLWAWRTGLAASMLLAAMIGLKGLEYQSDTSHAISGSAVDFDRFVDSMHDHRLVSDLDSADHSPFMQAVHRVASHVELDESGGGTETANLPVHAGHERALASSGGAAAGPLFWWSRRTPALGPSRPIEPHDPDSPAWKQPAEWTHEDGEGTSSNDDSSSPSMPDEPMFYYASGLNLSPHQ